MFARDPISADNHASHNHSALRPAMFALGLKMKYLCPRNWRRSSGSANEQFGACWPPAIYRLFVIGAKLWRTDQASLDDYIDTGQRACCDLALIRTPGM